MPFNTRNPIPSGDLRDLDDNARNIDTWANDQTKTSHPDRFGVQRYTWHGIEQKAQLDIAAGVAEATAEAGQYRDQALDAKNAAQEAAMMSGFSKYADTLAQLEAGIGTDYIEGDVVMVFQDESRGDTSSIFKIESGAPEFKLTFDKTRQDLLSFTGNIAADAQWSDVPAHSDPAFDAQTQSTNNRVRFLRSKQVLQYDSKSAALGEIAGLLPNDYVYARSERSTFVVKGGLLELDTRDAVYYIRESALAAVEDHSTVVNAALEQAATLGFRKVALPNGVYKSAAPFLMQSGVDFDANWSKFENLNKGDGNGFWIITAEGRTNFSIRGVDINDCHGGLLVKDCSNFVLEDFAISTFDAWNTYLCGIENFNIRNFRFKNAMGKPNAGYPLQSDGLHIVGPARHGLIEGIRGCNNDDMFCFQTDKDPLFSVGIFYPGSYGDVYDIIVRDVQTTTVGVDLQTPTLADSTHSMFAFNCKQHRIDKIWIDGVIGKYKGSSIINFSGKYLTEYTSDVGSIVFSNFDVSRTIVGDDSSASGYFPIMIESPVIEKITFRNFKLDLKELPGSSVIRVAPSTNPYIVFPDTPINIGELEFDNFRFHTTEEGGAAHFGNGSQFLLLHSKVTLNRLTINGLSIGGTQVKQLITVDGSVSRIDIDGLKVGLNNNGINNPTRGLFLSGTAVVGEVFAKNVTYRTVGGSAYDNDFLDIRSNVGFVSLKDFNVISSDGTAVGVRIPSSVSVGTLEIDSAMFNGAKYPFYILGNVGNLLLTDINEIDCINNPTVTGTPTIGFVKALGVRSNTTGTPLSISNSVSLGRIVSDVTYLGPMPTTPRAGDTWFNGADMYISRSAAIYKFSQAIAD